MGNLMKAQRIMGYRRAKRVHLGEVAAVSPWILLYIIRSIRSRDLSELHVVKKCRTLSSKPPKKFRHDEKLLYLCGAKPEERCRSGRSGRSRKPLYPYGYPGFESLSFRKKAALKAAFFTREGGMRTLEGFVTAQRSAKQRIPAFCESDLLSSICKIYTQYYTQKWQ